MLSLLAAAGAATIQLPPSLVTAQKERSENFASHYSSEVLRSADFEAYDHQDQLPIQGLTSAGGTSRSRYFQIRGIGERSSYEAMPNESVAVILDNVDYSGVGGVLDLTGMESIEVYKGPQNTLIGPSSLAGMIVGTSKSARADSLTLSTQAKTFDGLGVAIEKGNIYEFGNSYISASYKKEDGHFKNSYLKREDTNHIDELALKGKLNIEPFTLALHYFDFDNGYDVFNLSNSKTTISDKPGEDTQKTVGLSLSHAHHWDSGTLESIVSAHQTKTLYSYDEDWGNNDFWRALPGWNDVYDYNIEFTHEIENISLDERLSIAHGNFFHRSGLYLSLFKDDSRELGFKNEGVRKDLRAQFDRKRYSLYHESEFSYSNNLILFAGARLEQVNSDYKDNRSNHYTPEELLWGARLGARLHLNKNHHFVATLARGYKPGGINVGSNITSDRREFSEENLYQLSLKFYGDIKKFRYSTELFYALREDVQVKTSYQDDPSDPSSYTFYTDNGTSGKSFGGEAQVTWENLPFWQSEIHTSLLQTEYGNYRYGARNLKGRAFAYAPELSWRVGNTFLLSKTVSFLIEHDYQASYFFGNSHDERAPARLLTNASLTYRSAGWQAVLWGRNIFNDRAETRGFYFGNRPPNFSDERFVQVGAPATYGIKLQKTF